MLLQICRITPKAENIIKLLSKISLKETVTDENYYHHLVEFNVNFVNVIFILMILYATVKVFFANVKRGGILLTLIGVGSLYMLNLPRGYSDGFNGWIKQVIALCFKYGSSICVDFDVRSDDKTNSNIVILGNAGEGKSFLLKLILTNLRESGFDILNIDPNVEYVELTNNLGGVNIDLMGGKYTINPLEPTPWATDDNQTMLEVEAFSKTSALSQHISYLKDFFRCYKDFSDAAIDTLEIMLGKLYAKFNIFENTNLDKIPHNKFPLLTDLYAVIEEEYNKCEKGKKALYRSDTLQDLLLGLNSLCRGAESKYFNGHTNIKDGKMINFLIRGIMDTNAKLRDTILFNLLSYIQNRLLTKGRTFAGVDELHLFLNNLTTVKYLRAIMKQDRKMDSGLIIASQNVEDLTLPGIKEYTKPLLSIPTHQFFFYPGIVSSENFIDTLQLDPAEYKLINKPSRSHCLYRCGNERYLLKVIAPPYKAALFGTGGGR